MIDNSEFINYVISLGAELGLPCSEPERVHVDNLSGNINRVRRVSLNYDGSISRSFVVKHLPEGGKLEKYPTVTFPQSRLKFEAEWIRAFDEIGLGGEVRPPKLLHHDEEFHTLIFEDLGEKRSFGEELELGMCNGVENLGHFLGSFHALTADREPICNPAAEQNRPFVLTFPLQQPVYIQQLWKGKLGETCLFDELVGLQCWFVHEYSDALLPELIGLSHAFKASPFRVLTHGDLHGESILVVSEAVLGILDSELCDTGSAGFDVGTVIAHIWAHKTAVGEPSRDILKLVHTFFRSYESSLREHAELDSKTQQRLRAESLQYAGAEILRRTIGAALFPCLAKIQDKRALLINAKSMLLEPEAFADVLRKHDLDRITSGSSI